MKSQFQSARLSGAFALCALTVAGCARAQTAVPAPKGTQAKPAPKAPTPKVAAPQAQTPMSTQGWQPVPLMTAQQKADPSVAIGGEGAQWVRAVAWSRDAKLALWGTDVGGLFRSRNGGDTWEPCNVGYTPRGTAGIAIDPGNSNRVLSVGANSVASDYHGLWLSENGAASWKPVLPAKISGTVDNREQIAFDPQTYDAKLGLTRVVYWSRIANDKPKWGEAEVHPALYKSEDGGRTWAEIPDTAALGGSVLKVHPTQSIVYAANVSGLHRSSDGGAKWQTVLDGEITGLDVCATAPDCVWASRADGVYASTDAGLTWQKTDGANALVKAGFTLRNVHVAPSDANEMVLWRQQNDGWDWTRFYSGDGGKTWAASKIETKLSFLPTNARDGLFAFHPTNARVLLSTGGDYPTKSTDGGATYAWTGDGVNNILVGGAFHFNVQNPDVLFVGSQDYNGASTLDGGKTWTYQNPSGQSWGGFTYGGYAASPAVIVVGDGAAWQSEREITLTRDGGKTWNKTGHKFGGAESSMGAPGDPNVIFVSDWRSADLGQSWQEMSECSRVYTSDKAGNLWGVSGDDQSIVRSRDSGASWQSVAPKEKVADLAVTPDGNLLYAVAEGALWKCEDLKSEAPKWSKIESLVPDQWGGPRVKSVAVDPGNPNLVYLATSRDIFASSASAQRSQDGGKTWQNLTRQTPLDTKIASGKDGGREAIWVRVNPKTREAWFATSCYGIWKIGPPG